MCSCSGPLSASQVGGTTTCLLKRRSFGTFYNGGRVGGSAIEAVFSVSVRGANTSVIVDCAKSKFLRGVVEVVAKALVRINSKEGGPSTIVRVLTSGSETRTNCATPTYKLELREMSCNGIMY